MWQTLNTLDLVFGKSLFAVGQQINLMLREKHKGRDKYPAPALGDRDYEINKVSKHLKSNLFLLVGMSFNRHVCRVHAD